ncbi:MAG TPA: sulfatase-like hydrolase/transferase [Acidobacteriota bacterium]|nr:sulfatase-like hydrolase/transferase [Acidobacteriota bacterium]
MKISAKQESYLRRNYRHKSDEIMSEELSVSKSFIRKALKKLNLKRTEAELKNLHKPNFSDQSRESTFRLPKKKKVRLICFILVGIGLAVLLFFVLKGGIWKNYGGKIKESLKQPDLNILFITLDTTRADHISCYGYENVKTKHIDSLAESGILFKNTICQSPLTLPSHSSIFTGTYPFFHGARDNGLYLAEENITFAEVLKEHGWATSAFIGAFVLDSTWGLDQGFDYYFDDFDFSKYEQITLSSVQREGGEVIKPFFEWLESHYQEKFFSWIHLYDPHSPYDPPEPYRTQYGNRKWGLYDGEIAYVDFLIGRVLDELMKKGLDEKTVIIILGDHGESLGEHEEIRHGFFVYDASIKVPFIVRIPEFMFNGKVIESQVETVDIMPTLLEILDLPVPPDIQGKSLIPLILGKKQDEEESLAYSETYYPRYHFGWSELKSLRSQSFKFIKAPRPELYDLNQDRGEKINLYHRNREVALRFEKKLEDFQKKSNRGEEQERPVSRLDEKDLERLRALGYIGGFESQSKVNNEDLADPKDKIHLYKKIKVAQGQFAEKNLEEALKEISYVIENDPNIMEARETRARILLDMDRVEEALEECKETLEIDPEYEAAIFTLALSYKRLKKYHEAILGYERLIELDPRDHKPHQNLGEIYLELDEVDEAIACFNRVIDLEPERSARAHNLLGTAYLKKERLDSSQEEIQKALNLRTRIPDAHYNLALIHEKRGEYLKAAEEYQKEIELFPSDFSAHFNLAKLFINMGKIEEGILHYRKCIELDPKFSKAYLFLAKVYLDIGKNFQEVIELSKKGLELDPESEYAPLAHFILADIYNRQGKMDLYKEQLRKGEQLKKKLGKKEKRENK